MSDVCCRNPPQQGNEFGDLELLCVEDDHDIKLQFTDQSSGKSQGYSRDRIFQDKSVGIDHSLRQYCQVLYLKPRMKISIFGEKACLASPSTADGCCNCRYTQS
jgi:hypothetical protein